MAMAAIINVYFPFFWYPFMGQSYCIKSISAFLRAKSTCTYIIVLLMSSWPSNSFKTSSRPPALKKRVAKVCLAVCGLQVLLISSFTAISANSFLILASDGCVNSLPFWVLISRLASGCSGISTTKLVPVLAFVGSKNSTSFRMLAWVSR